MTEKELTVEEVCAALNGYDGGKGWRDELWRYESDAFYADIGGVIEIHPVDAAALAAGWQARAELAVTTAEIARLNRIYVHPEPSVSNPCTICGTPIYGSYVGDGDGSMKDGGRFAHPYCFRERELKAEIVRLNNLCDDLHVRHTRDLGEAAEARAAVVATNEDLKAQLAALTDSYGDVVLRATLQLEPKIDELSEELERAVAENVRLKAEVAERTVDAEAAEASADHLSKQLKATATAPTPGTWNWALLALKAGNRVQRKRWGSTYIAAIHSGEPIKVRNEYGWYVWASYFTDLDATDWQIAETSE